MSRKAALSPGRLALALAACLLVVTVGAGPALSANRAPDKLSSVTPTARETGTVSFSWLASLAAAAASELSATKDANPSYSRTFEWEIVKSVDQASQTIPAGGSATFNYTITVTHDEGTDSDWQVSGQITVTNPNTAVVTGVTVTDAIDDPNAICAVSGGSSTIPTSGAIAFDYVCTYSAAPASPSQTNTATISWPAQTLANSASLSAGSVTAEAAVLWGDPTAILNGDVDVLDTLAGRLASVSYTDPSTQTFTYPLTFEDDPVGTCTEHDNRARVRNDATTIASSDTVTVQVCSGGSDLTVTKTAIPSFTRTFGWEVEKSVDQPSRRIPAGGNATFNYTVDVTKGPAVDSDWAIAGAITVSNSNGFDVNADLADTAPGGNCSLEQTSVTVPANDSVSVGYSCTFTDGASGQNTATASWDSAAYSTPTGSASGTAGYVFETPTNRVNDSVDVFDNGNLLGATDHSTQFTYAKSFPGIAGTCTSYDNTATVRSNATLLASDTVTVEVCVTGDLTVTKTATPSFTRTFGWQVEKSVDQPSRRIPAGGNATFNYTVDVTKGPAVDSGWAIAGTITVQQPQRWGHQRELGRHRPGRELLARANERDGSRERIRFGRLFVHVPGRSSRPEHGDGELGQRRLLHSDRLSLGQRRLRLHRTDAARGRQRGGVRQRQPARNDRSLDPVHLSEELPRSRRHLHRLRQHRDSQEPDHTARLRHGHRRGLRQRRPDGHEDRDPVVHEEVRLGGGEVGRPDRPADPGRRHRDLQLHRRREQGRRG